MRAVIIAALLAAAPAAAQEAEDGRYQMERVGDDILRLDTRSGRVELCEGAAGAFDCREVLPASVDGGTPAGVSDDVAGLRDEVARLRRENAQLAARLARVAAALEGFSPDTGALTAPGGISSTARREIDEAIDVTDYALRRFRDLFRSLSEENASDR